jgi:glutathione S-transferase
MSMANNLVFYTNPMSRGRIVRWMLEEVGEPYKTELLEYGTTMKAPDYLAINPMGKVPALRHGDAVITESAAICAYLADAFPAAKLAPPPGDRDRGPYYRWLFFAAGPLEAAVINNFLGVEVPPDKRPMVGSAACRVLDTVEQAVKDRDIRRQSLQRGGSLRRRPPRLGHAVRHRREAQGLRALLRQPGQAAGVEESVADRRGAAAGATAGPARRLTLERPACTWQRRGCRAQGVTRTWPDSCRR